MRERNSARTVHAGECRNLLSISPCSEDHLALRHFLSSSEWKIRCASSLHRAQRLLAQDSFTLAICERDLLPGSWKDILAGVLALPVPLLLIVTSIHADDRLWSEALNLGAFDVLAKPLQDAEVVRTVASASWHTESRGGRSKAAVRAAG